MCLSVIADKPLRKPVTKKTELFYYDLGPQTSLKNYKICILKILSHLIESNPNRLKPYTNNHKYLSRYFIQLQIKKHRWLLQIKHRVIHR